MVGCVSDWVEGIVGLVIASGRAHACVSGWMRVIGSVDVCCPVL